MEYSTNGQWTEFVGIEPPAPGVVVTADPYDCVVWTTATGIVVVSEARCPHMWSHFAAEGTVIGEELVCMSHGWCFAVDGVGSKPTIGGRVDEKAPIRIYPSRVEGNVVFAWLPKDSTVSDEERQP